MIDNYRCILGSEHTPFPLVLLLYCNAYACGRTLELSEEFASLIGFVADSSVLQLILSMGARHKVAVMTYGLRSAQFYDTARTDA